MALEGRRDDPEVEKLRVHLEEANTKFKGASVEFKRMRDVLTNAQINNGQLAIDVRAASDCYKAMRDNMDRLELDLGSRLRRMLIWLTNLRWRK